MNDEFTLYAVICRYFGGLPSEHTYVHTSDGQNFNCFGGSGGGHVVLRSKGSGKWAKMLYGNYQGCGDDQPAAGLRVRYDGVCQTASSRILAVTGDGDARATKGNVLATLLYGKFGFNIEKFVEAVKSTGAQLMQLDPGEIQPSDIDLVLQRIEVGQSPDAELDILHVDVQDQASIALPPITDSQRQLFCPIYADYQAERKEVFLRVSNAVPYGTEIACGEYPKQLQQPLATCVRRLKEGLGVEEFRKLFGASPDQLASKLNGFN